MKRRLFLLSSFLVFSYFLVGFYLATFDASIFKPLTLNEPHPFFHDYRGITHVSTLHSKGSQEPSSILLEAAEADIQFLVFTDLNLFGRPYNVQGYQGDVFTLTNQKVSYLDSHILVYSDQADFSFENLGEAQAQLHNQLFAEGSESQEFMTVLAHPFKAHHRWSGPFPPGLDGIEVINLRQLWQEGWIKDKPRFLWSLFTYPFNPNVALFRLIREPQRELQLWDELNSSQKTIGFLGNEATARNFNIMGMNLTFLSYQKSFEFASNHILLSTELTGHGSTDRSKIYTALNKGQFYMAFDSLGSPLGFAAYAVCDGERFPMGSQLPKSSCRLQVDLPKNLRSPVRTDLYHNGRYLESSEQLSSSFPMSKSGVYRVIVRVQPPLPRPDRKRWFSWIYTNPFYRID